MAVMKVNLKVILQSSSVTVCKFVGWENNMRHEKVSVASVLNLCKYPVVYLLVKRGL
jgi:hypothetical protein